MNNNYGRNYLPSYNLNQQNMGDQIDYQINELQKMKQQMQQPIPITQNFQLAPNNNGIRYANTIEDVEMEQIFYDTPFFSKDMSIVWIKNIKNEIKTYELSEIVPKDEKDIQIEYLQEQINELKKGIENNEWNNSNVATKQDATNTTRNDEPIRATTKENKPTSIQKISTSKKEQ